MKWTLTGMDTACGRREEKKTTTTETLNYLSCWVTKFGSSRCRVTISNELKISGGLSCHSTSFKQPTCEMTNARGSATINLPDGVLFRRFLFLFLRRAFVRLNEIIKTLFLLAIRSPSRHFVAPTRAPPHRNLVSSQSQWVVYEGVVISQQSTSTRGESIKWSRFESRRLLNETEHRLGSY